jgi:hypothetical protein
MHRYEPAQQIEEELEDGVEEMNIDEETSNNERHSQ